MFQRFLRSLRPAISVPVALALLFAWLTPASQGDEGELHVGLAQVKITPTEPIHMAGYASRNKPSEGVLADLYAKALAIEDSAGQQAVVLTVDVIGFSADVAEFICNRINKETKLARSQILLCPSHTHTGPVIGIRGSIGYGLEGEAADVVHNFCTHLADQLATISAQALGDLQPAKLSWGTGVTNIVMNRREFTERGVRLGFNPRGYVDRSVPVLRVDDLDGKPARSCLGAPATTRR